MYTGIDWVLMGFPRTVREFGAPRKKTYGKSSYGTVRENGAPYGLTVYRRHYTTKHKHHQPRDICTNTMTITKHIQNAYMPKMLLIGNHTI